MRTSTLLLAFLAAAVPVRAQESTGFRVRGWVQWDQQRIDLGDGYVSGPHGVGFTVTARLDAAAFTVRVRPEVAGDSTRYSASIEVRVPVSDSQAPTPLYAIDSYGRSVTVRRGDAAELGLPFHPEPGESATLRLRIEGPAEARPPATGRWKERMVREARGVYFRTAGYQPALTVTPNVCPGALAVHLASVNSPSGVDVLACGDEATPVAIPGLGGQWYVMILARRRAQPDDQCLGISQAPPRGQVGGYRPRSSADWCLSPEQRWSAVPLRLSTGETVRAQLIP